jgi:transcription elongation regulator 1
LEPKKKKEKPKEKIPIPGTTWTKVSTTAGNIFYTEKESKRSSWTIPDEIQEEVAAYEESVKQAEREREEAERREKEKERLDVLKERERIRLEIEEERQLKRELEEERRAQEREAQRKRKEMDQADATDNHDDIERPSKVQRVDEEVVSEDDAEEGEGQAGPLDEEDEEAWQKAVAAEIAAEHAIAEAEKKAQKAAAKAEQEEAKRAVFHAPAKVDLTLEEGRALFKVRWAVVIRMHGF